MQIADLIDGLAGRVRAFLAGDVGAVLDGEALAEGERLAGSGVTDPDQAWLSARALAWLFWCRYQALPEGEGEVDLVRSLPLFEIVAEVDRGQVPAPVQALLEKDYAHPRVRAMHAGSLLRRHTATGEAKALDQAIANYAAAISGTPADDPERLGDLSNLGAAWHLRFKRTGDGADLDRAIGAWRSALAAAPDRHHHRPVYLSNLGDALVDRFAVAGDVGALDEAVDLGTRAVEATPGGHPDRALFRSKLAHALKCRFTRTGDGADLEIALDLLGEAVATAPAGHPQGATILANFAGALGVRYRRHGDPEDLDRAIGLLRDLLETDPDDAATLSEVGRDLGLRYSRTGDRDDIEESAACCRRAVAATPATDPSRPIRLLNHGTVLWFRFKHLGDRAALDQALASVQEAVDSTSSSHPTYPLLLSNLGNLLRSRFESGGPRSDIERAVELGRRAVEAAGPGDPELKLHRANLAAAMRTRTEHFGGDADIETVIRLNREVLEHSGADDPDHGGHLSGLGEALLARYTQLGDGADLDEAVATLYRAVDATPPEHTERSTRLLNLEAALWTRFNRSGGTTDLDRAVETGRRAVAATAPDHPNLSPRLASLTAALTTRAERAGDDGAVEEAVETGRRAARTESLDPSDHAICLLNLAGALQERFKRHRDERDLEEATTLFRRAVDDIPDGHPNQIRILAGLADALRARFRLDGDPALLDLVVDLERRAASIGTAPLSDRIRAAQRGARTAMSRGHRTGRAEAETEGDRIALGMLRNAIELLPLLVWPGLDREDQQRLLEETARSLGADAAACAIAVGDPAGAVELLEQSRGVLWGRLLDLRTGTGGLAAAHPALADELDRCRRELDRTAFEAHRRTRRNDAARRFETLLDEVRSLPPSEDFPRPRDFLRPPALDDLLPPAGTGPVVVLNVSDRRCDALIVDASGIEAVPLPITAAESFEQGNRYLAALQNRTGPDAPLSERETAPVLAWAWDSIAAPVLGRLESRPARPRRIWWCPTGPLTLLPIHAAGHHTEPGRAVMDHVVSSYTPTLRALADARARTAAEDDGRLLIVAVADTPSGDGGPAEHTELPGAGAERRLLEDALGRDRCTVLQDGEATREAVVSGLGAHRAAHIACHGTQDLRRPSRGGLVPHDWRTAGLVGIGDLTRPGTGGEFAFLSACQTATGGVTNLDEAVSVTAAMHYAGWRHVIGTLWSVYDGAATVVAAHLYSRILEEGRLDPADSARALHVAVRVLRDQHPDRTAYWARFIHTGP
ncbi:CHAT domain-containing protein [Glycomyces xiaoerkulensis]|uniref:CHAT domain-containing protein n=1 Tax=Glycomyces xiaoerkulensis TaxID=2038139 RepID=UPI000C263E22|nr:CHAT domain-containing protein [Glycomyces xiaoerkulensis]